MSTGPITPSDLVLYRSPKGVVKVGVLVRDETVWLTQRALSELFAVGVPAIAKHLKNIFDSGELEPSATISKMETVQREGERQVMWSIEFYNLDPVILSDKGRVSALEAKLKAEAEYDAFRVRQDREFVSDFDRVVEEAKQLGEAAKAKKLPRKRKRETKS
jgi:hypothetical protein